MQDPTVQGQPLTEPAVPPGQGQPAAEPAVLDSLQQFVVPSEPAAEPAATQGQPQGQPQGVQSTQIDSAKYFQSQYNQSQADNFRLQRELEEVRRTQSPQQAEQNPFDPNADYFRWNSFERRKDIMEATKLASEETERRITSQLSQAVQRQSELQWQSSHPNVDIQALRAFAQTRWNTRDVSLQMLDDAIVLLNLPNQLNQARTGAIQQTFDNFRQPTTGAQALRGGGPAESGVVGLSYVKMAEEYARNPGIYDTWPEALRREFDRVTDFERARMRRG